jgi:ABC-type transporter Mla maintaining outer membrane lipid asymmetry ATPase subunit MlaF
MTIAVTTTTKRLGPSGSLKKKNIILEHIREVVAKISGKIFFEGECIAPVYSKELENVLTNLILYVAGVQGLGHETNSSLRSS